jgi:hypothetical protein
VASLDREVIQCNTRGWVREEIMALLVISHAACLLVGGSIGFLVAAICAMASDKGAQSHTEYGRATAVRQAAGGHARLI